MSLKMVICLIRNPFRLGLGTPRVDHQHLYAPGITLLKCTILKFRTAHTVYVLERIDRNPTVTKSGALENA